MSNTERQAEAMITASNQVMTIRLKRTGIEVLAKLYKGELTAITYANRTQAENSASKLGAGWCAYQGMGRPFYVTLA